MKSVSVTIFRIFFLCSAFIFTISGCGSSSSSGSATNSATGSIAAKLVWSNQASKETAKTLYAAPAGVITVRIIVSAPDMATIFKNFDAATGSGTIDGIPVGNGRTVRVWGLDATGIIRYQGAVSGITVNQGTNNPPVQITMHAPVTSASPAGGSSSYPLNVHLAAVTASEPATIYYTTSGIEPTTSSSHGTSPFDIQILAPTTLRFFAIDAGFAQEATKTVEYQ